MANLPYVVSYKNLPTLFEKINSAKIPETGFTYNFLLTTIGLKSTNDRAYIPLLRHLGFLDQSSVPTPHYRLLKGDKRKAALADGIRRAYGPLFDADQEANKLSGEKLRSLVAQVAGTDADLTGRISGTFLSLVNLADFESSTATEEKKADGKDDAGDQQADQDTQRYKPKGLRTEFHYNIQVQLPSNGTEETYLNIFNAIRKTFQ
ncbi:DUF5343 domain-containing protein [Bradyrhizobium sp. ISRA443]|uniref:DUF5343 domain-containing protein n=1 Tax=unclassified Bradyrhizobium TaxID=2631580 RepID=UPI002478B0BD|nr:MULTISPECIES: DUF5343 domain-containing protein [unclassified Bradyrhizobium]WGR94858.1 DUF5343 domain-containing protein [Bradyrhizobium sp. ISRA435]WGR99712.1 DUF5343 domain-containing protein [Bradyrhizobium sp. ISRA436]WGS06602.1 DUF5343 domain-containing protein [Bradyrhizobium sp. ISRA437]WGS13486.1 DUF5343 domain-containing protein [Bradyrhizobium sp. ISRA443]